MLAEIPGEMIGKGRGDVPRRDEGDFIFGEGREFHPLIWVFALLRGRVGA